MRLNVSKKEKVSHIVHFKHIVAFPSQILMKFISLISVP